MRAVTHGVPTSFWSGTTIASSRDCEPHEGAVWRPCHDGTRDVTNWCDSVLCHIRLPARNSHAGPDEITTRARPFISLGAPVTDGPLGLPRINARRVGRVTRSEPPDTSSIATERDSRNPSAPSPSEPTSPAVPPQIPARCLTPKGPHLIRRSNHPILFSVSVAASRRDSATRRRASSRMRLTAAWCSFARGSSSSNCASASSAVSGLLKAC